MVQKDSRSVHPTAYDTVREAASSVSIHQPRPLRAPKLSDIVNPAASPTKVSRHLEASPSVSVGASKVSDHWDNAVGASNGTGSVVAGESNVPVPRKPVIVEPTDNVFPGASKAPDHRKTPVVADSGIHTSKVSSPRYEGTDQTHNTSPAPKAPRAPSSQNEHTDGALITSGPAANGLNQIEYVKPSPNIKTSEGNVHQEPPAAACWVKFKTFWTRKKRSQVQ